MSNVFGRLCLWAGVCSFFGVVYQAATWGMESLPAALAFLGALLLFLCLQVRSDRS